MRFLLFVPMCLCLAQQIQPLMNGTNIEEIVSSVKIQVARDEALISITPTVTNNAAPSNHQVPSTNDTIVVFIPTSVLTTITERTIELQSTTITEVHQQTSVSLSVSVMTSLSISTSVHATTILPTIRRPVLRGQETDQASCSIRTDTSRIIWSIPLLSAILLNRL